MIAIDLTDMNGSPEETCALTRALKWLERANLRATRQRLQLATLLVGDGQHRHVFAESLHQAY